MRQPDLKYDGWRKIRPISRQRYPWDLPNKHAQHHTRRNKHRANCHTRQQRQQQQYQADQVRAQLLLGLIRWPLRNATVKLQQEIDDSFITIGEQQTDLLGRYRFDNLDEGAFRISARAEGFAAETVDITIEGGKRIIKNLALEPQQESPAAAARLEKAVPLYHNNTPRAAASTPASLG